MCKVLAHKKSPVNADLLFEGSLQEESSPGTPVGRLVLHQAENESEFFLFPICVFLKWHFLIGPN